MIRIRANRFARITLRIASATKIAVNGRESPLMAVNGGYTPVQKKGPNWGHVIRGLGGLPRQTSKNFALEGFRVETRLRVSPSTVGRAIGKTDGLHSKPFWASLNLWLSNWGLKVLVHN